MEPTLKQNSEVLVSSLPYFLASPRLGDIIAVKDPRDNKILIKRITKIADQKYFVEGDNKKHSTDSRKFGMIEKNHIIGKVIAS